MKSFLKKEINSNLVQEFDNYLMEGGFPKAVQYDSLQDKKTYVSSVISEIFEKDIIGKLECDFILRKDLYYSYLQVCMTIMSSKETEEREYRPLESIKDNYPKYVITRNDPIQNRNGIIHVNMPEFMKEGKLF